MKGYLHGYIYLGPLVLISYHHIINYFIHSSIYNYLSYNGCLCLQIILNIIVNLQTLFVTLVLKQLTQKKVLKSLVVTIQVEDKGTNINPVNITTQEEDKPVEVKTYSEVAVQAT